MIEQHEQLSGSAEAMAGSSHLDGAALGLLWAIPFAGLLLSIALLPLVTPHFWERHFGKVATFWALALLVPCIIFSGFSTATEEVLHTLLVDYVPFILLLFTLFVVAGGISVSGNLVGTPATNTAILAFGALSASFLGTTGASMVLIRPMIKANRHRVQKTHVFVFFIFLVSNIGGSLTPLGDPPLFLGFLKGVDFQWTFQAMLLPMLFVSSVLLGIFYVIDRLAWKREPPEIEGKKSVTRQLRIDGLHNVLFHLGADAGGGDAVRRHLRHDDPDAGDAEGRRSRAFWCVAYSRLGPRWATDRRRLFLADWVAIEPSRQRADLSCVLQPRRWRRARTHGAARLHPPRYLCGRRLHGRPHLYRQRAELHGAVDLRGARCEDAELHRLHGVVGSDPVAALRGGHSHLVPVRRFNLSAGRRWPPKLQWPPPDHASAGRAGV